MSQLEVNKVLPQSGTTLTLGESGDTITIPSGATLDASSGTLTLPDGTVTNAKVNASAAIAYSKLNLATSIVNADISTTAAIATTKLGAGAVLQVVSTTKIDTFTLSSTTTFTDITGLSVSITPSSTSNKILIIVAISNGNTVGTSVNAFRLVRGATAIGGGTASGNRQSAFATGQPPDANGMLSSCLNFLDSPSTTSSTTYKIQGICNNTMTINRTGNDLDIADSYGTRLSSTITVMEIAG
jgi:hypothetical protein